MATAVLTKTDRLATPGIDIDDRQGWGFALLLATTATLFVRPADLVPAFDDWPIYQVLIIACLVVSARACLRQFSHAQLIRSPITTGLLALLFSVGVSHLSHRFVWGARTSMFEVSKLIMLYGLILGLINTPTRLSLFVKWLTLAITLMAALALLDRYGYVSIAALESIQDRGGIQDGLVTEVERLRGTGIFQDPNDFGLILVTGILLCVSLLTKPGVGWPRYRWLAPLGVLLSALALTHSRGALLSMLCGILAAVCYFRGGKYGVLALLGLPLPALVFSSRMTDIDAINAGTGQDRLQIWSETLEVWRQYPLFGLGEGLIADEIGMVTHNSFLQCYAELGFLGGTAFVACFLAAGLALWSQRLPTSDQAKAGNSLWEAKIEFSRLCGYLFAALMACIVAMLTLSRQFVAPPYLILGLVAAATSTSAVGSGCRDDCQLQIGNRFLFLSLMVSIASLLAIYLTVRIFVRW